MWLGNYTEDEVRKLLDEECIQTMREVFDGLDEHGDLLVVRSQLLKEMRQDQMMRSMLERNVFYIGAIDKHVTVAQVIRHIEDEMIEQLKTDPRGHYYITWGEFDSYFRLLRKVGQCKTETCTKTWG